MFRYGAMKMKQNNWAGKEKLMLKSTSILEREMQSTKHIAVVAAANR